MGLEFPSVPQRLVDRREQGELGWVHVGSVPAAQLLDEVPLAFLVELKDESGLPLYQFVGQPERCLASDERGHRREGHFTVRGIFHFGTGVLVNQDHEFHFMERLVDVLVLIAPRRDSLDDLEGRVFLEDPVLQPASGCELEVRLLVDEGLSAEATGPTRGVALDTPKCQGEVRASNGPVLHPLLVDSRKAGSAFAEPLIVREERRLLRLRGATNHNGREVPRRVVAISVKRGEDFILEDLYVRVRPASVLRLHTHLVRCEFEGLVALSPSFEVLLAFLAEHGGACLAHSEVRSGSCSMDRVRDHVRWTGLGTTEERSIVLEPEGRHMPIFCQWNRAFVMMRPFLVKARPFEVVRISR